MFEIISLHPQDTRMGDFWDLPWQIYPGKIPWVPPLKAKLCQELNPDQPFFRHGQAQIFLALERDIPIGRIVASIDTHLQTVGHFGYFECQNRPEVAQALLNAARHWVAQQGRTEIHGPVDLHIFNRYRVQIAGFDTTPFLGEPRSPAYYPALLEAAGLEQYTRWHSWDLSAIQLQNMYQYLQQKIAQLRTHRPAAYRLQTLRLQNLHEDLELAWRIGMEVFAANYGFTPLDLPEFMQAFAGVAELMQLHPDLFGLFYHGQDVIGLGYAYLDYAPFFQRLNGDSREFSNISKERPERLILHTFGIHPAHRHSELAYDMFYHGIKHGLAYGVQTAIGALAKEGRSIYAQFGPPSRSYAIYKGSV